MKSVRWNNLKQTFRFRLTVLYVLMMSVALTVTFILFLLLARTYAAGFARDEMETALRSAETAYMGQNKEDTEQLPEQLLERVGRQFPNIHIGLVEQEVQPGGILYEIIASTGDEWLEILADPSGDIWVADRKPVQDVFVDMEESVQSEGNAQIALFLCAPDGALLAGFLPENDPEDIRLVMDRAKGVPVVRRGGDLYGVVVLYDGNRLYAVRPMAEMERITRWSFALFAVFVVVFIPLSGLIGFFVSRKAMDGVRRVTDAAARVRAGNFKEQVPRAAEGTEIDELVDAFNLMVLRIEVLMRELRDVTADIAHDLKTPIMHIRASLESMEWYETSPPERKELVAKALEECDLVVPLIDSILEVSRAEAGILVLQNEAFDLAEEVRRACDIFSAVADDRKTALHYAVPDRPVSVVGDRGRIQRVIANLIDNALKFTPDGGDVAVRLEIFPDQAILTVSDNGPGIPKAELENVFKRFYRLDPSRGIPGYGMGLSLVKAFILSFGGSVSIESDIGKGCAVKVVFPV